jgi:hypothetical protein
MSNNLTRTDALKAIDELLADLKNDPDSWENPTLDRYLDAMHAWLKDSAKTKDEPPSWELIINMLKAARVYE